MPTISPTGNYSLQLPTDIKQEVDGQVHSFWRPGSTVALQVSSYAREFGPQVPAEQRLRDRIGKSIGKWRRMYFCLAHERGADVAAAAVVDDDGYEWLHAYITWPDLAIYATLSRDSREDVVTQQWALDALSSIRRDLVQ